MTEYLLILISAVFVNNIVMVKFLGLYPFMGVSKKLEAAFCMGAATALVLTLASAASYLINRYFLGLWPDLVNRNLLGLWPDLVNRNLLGPELAYLTTLWFIVVIATIVHITALVIRKTSPLRYQVPGIYLLLITTNCAVLGIPLLNVQAKHDFMESIFFGLGGALGFTLLMVLFAAIRERLEGTDVPGIFKGTPIAIVTAGLMSLAFMGFSGLVK